MLRSRRRSSAPPPKGLNAKMAATRLASRSTPRTARMATRGSFHLSVARLPDRLKFLGIVHGEAIAEQGLRLRRRLINILGDGAEQLRTFKRPVEIDDRLRTLRAYLQAEDNLVASGNVGLDVEHLHVGRQGLF